MANFSDAAREVLVSGAIVANVLGPAAPIGLAQADLAPAEQQATMQLVDNTREAVNAFVEGKSAADDAASAEPVPEAESSETSDPPDGWTNAWLDWGQQDATASDGDALEAPEAAEAAEAIDSSDPADSGSEGFGDV